MPINVLKSLSMAKYERLLPRIFNGAVRFEIRDRQGKLFWHTCTNSATEQSGDPDVESAAVVWSDLGSNIQRRQNSCGELQFRAPLLVQGLDQIGWLTVGYDSQPSVPVTTAPEPLRRAFADVAAFLQEEVQLQAECNQLALELTERYEELNLVYSTKDQVEYFEEGQEALARLVHNCADYLDVGLAALICRDRDLTLHNVDSSNAPPGVDNLLEYLETTIYDRVESQVASVVLNETDDEDRRRLLGGREENVLAYPIIDNHGTAIGLLAVVARRDKHTFSNGDRNLLEVMAKKAARIIHTHHDSLTGLMNRNGFESTLIVSLASAQNKNLEHCLLHIDIDQLHVVNDLMGHQEGDNLIRRVAKTLRTVLRDSDYVARLGGDEFGVLLSNCNLDQGHPVAEKIRKAIHELTVVSANRQLDVTVSIGVALINHETEGIAGVMASAEIACKATKEEGRDRVQVFQEDNTTLVRRSEEIEWIGKVQQALRDDRFQLHCQPVMPISKNHDALHFEILLRMLGDDDEILLPALFMPAAERYQLMPLVDRWVVRSSLQVLGSVWPSILATDTVFCVNLSGQSLTNNGFLAFVKEEIQGSGVPPRNVCFEITETAAISNIDEAVAFMNALQEVGCRFALDDFGAGLSSFAYLKVLPVDYLKIDGSFVREVTTDKFSRSMINAMCQIGQTMGLSIIAEFVDDDETVAVLRRAGVDFVQGFHIGKPAPLKEITDLLQNGQQVESA